MTKTILLTNVATTLFLVGLIWTIQVVHYPLFEKVGVDEYVSYQYGHQWRITVVVLPVMLLEIATAAALLWIRPHEITNISAWVGFGLVGIIWFSTFFLQSPQHVILDRGFNQAAFEFLVNSNWLRTIAWTMRGGLVLYWLSKMIK